MYCRHCGKEIAEDSAFCQYCGEQLHEQEKKKSSGSLLNRFKSLSKGWQITIMIYAVWFLTGLCVLVGLGPYGKYKDYYLSEVLWPVLLLVVILPLVAFFFWYYFTRLRKTEKKNTIENQAITNNVITKPIQNLKMISEPLMDFAKQYGKMQVKTVANPTTNEVHSFCAFINEQGIETKVEFGKTLGVLRPQEIVERKDQLVVVQKLDGSFELKAK